MVKIYRDSSLFDHDLTVNSVSINKENKFLKYLKITTLVLGILTILTGTLILTGIPYLSLLGTTLGWTLLSSGCFVIFVVSLVKLASFKKSNEIKKADETSELRLKFTNPAGGESNLNQPQAKAITERGSSSAGISSNKTSNNNQKASSIVPSYVYSYRRNLQVANPKSYTDSDIKEKIDHNEESFLITLLKEDSISKEQVQKFGQDMLVVAIIKDNAELARLLLEKSIPIFRDIIPSQINLTQFILSEISYDINCYSLLDLAVFNESCLVIPLLLNAIPSSMWSDSDYSEISPGTFTINPFIRAILIAIKLNKIHSFKVLASLFPSDYPNHRRLIFFAYLSIISLQSEDQISQREQDVFLITTYIINKTSIVNDSEFYLRNLNLIKRSFSNFSISNFSIFMELYYFPIIEFLLENGLDPFTTFDFYNSLTLTREKSSAIKYWFANTSSPLSLAMERHIYQKLIDLDIIHTAVAGNKDIRDLQLIGFFSLIYSPDDINRYNVDGDTPLHLAVRNLNIQAVSFLLEVKADPTIKNPHSFLSAFEEVILLQNIDILEILLHQEEILKKKNAVFGGLRFAIRHQKCNAFKVLFKNTNINARKCRQLINLALKNNCEEIATILLHHLSLSTYLCKKGFFSKKTDPSVQKMCKLENCMLENVYPQFLGRFLNSLCYKNNGTFYIENLFTAVENDNYFAIRFYLEAGVNADVLNANDWTPLLRAISLDRLDLIKLFLDSKADPNFTTKELNYDFCITPLVLACKNITANSKNILKLLLNFGANIKINSICSAIIFGNLFALNLFYEKNPDIFKLESEMIFYALVSSIETFANLIIIEKFLKFQFDLSYQNKAGNTFLHCISASKMLSLDKRYTLLKKLLELGVSPLIVNNNHRYFWQELSKAELLYCKERFKEDRFFFIATHLDETRLPSDFLPLLPDEMLTKIFDHLTKENLTSSRLVSYFWSINGVINETLDKKLKFSN